MVFAGSPSGVFGAIKSTRVGLASAGRRLYPAGDIDGDGVADLLLGGLAAGSSLVLRGPATRGVGGWASAQPNPVPCVLPAGALMSLEAATAPLGDINGDGLDDVASLIAGHCGAVFFGRASPPGSSPTTLPETELPRFEMPVGVALPPMLTVRAPPFAENPPPPNCESFAHCTWPAPPPRERLNVPLVSSKPPAKLERPLSVRLAFEESPTPSSACSIPLTPDWPVKPLLLLVRIRRWPLEIKPMSNCPPPLTCPASVVD